RARGPLRHRSELGHPAGRVLPGLRSAGPADGPAASSLRAARLAGDHRHRALLDPGGTVRGVRAGALLRRLHRPGWCRVTPGSVLGSFPFRRVAVVGLGRSGAAAARLLARSGVEVRVSERDDSPAVAGIAAELAALGVATELGPHRRGIVDGADALVVSPGVPPDNPVIVRALERGLPVWSEVELAWRLLTLIRSASDQPPSSRGLAEGLIRSASARPPSSRGLAEGLIRSASARPPSSRGL